MWTAKTFAIVSCLIASVSSLSLPGSVSEQCTTFLTNLDSDTALQQCLQPVASAVSGFDAVQGATGGSVDAALSTLCGAQSTCQLDSFSQTMGDFATACSTELASGAGNSAVADLYDLIYLIYPFTEAVCSVDSTDQRCLNVLSAAANSANETLHGAVIDFAETGNAKAAFAVQHYALPGPLFVNLAQSYAKRAIKKLARRSISLSFASSAAPSSAPASAAPSSFAASPSHTDSAASKSGSSVSVAPTAAPSASGVVVAPGQSTTDINVPNSNTWTSSGLAYLFLNDKLPQSVLCGDCAKTVLAQYVGYFKAVPYAGGISSSPTLRGMTALWSSVGSTCGNDTLAQINVQATVQVPAATGGAARLALSSILPIALALLMTTFML